MVNESKNLSVESIKEDSDTEEISIQTNPEIIGDNTVPRRSATSGIPCKRPMDEEECYMSTNNTDVDSSRKYPITLEEARERTLKAIRALKERTLSFGEDE